MTQRTQISAGSSLSASPASSAVNAFYRILRTENVRHPSPVLLTPDLRDIVMPGAVDDEKFSGYARRRVNRLAHPHGDDHIAPAVRNVHGHFQGADATECIE